MSSSVDHCDSCDHDDGRRLYDDLVHDDELNEVNSRTCCVLDDAHYCDCDRVHVRVRDRDREMLVLRMWSLLICLCEMIVVMMICCAWVVEWQMSLVELYQCSLR